MCYEYKFIFIYSIQTFQSVYIPLPPGFTTRTTPLPGSGESINSEC